MTSFLSIDLDYWNVGGISAAKKFLNKLLPLILTNKLPVEFIVEHHAGLDFVNKYPADELILIDYHSDIAEYADWESRIKNKVTDHGEIDFNCGTWGNYVAWKEKKTFSWFYPDKTCVCDYSDSRCEFNQQTGMWKKSGRNNWIHICGWEDLKWKFGLPNLNKKDLIAVQICLSPDYFRTNENTLLFSNLFLDCYDKIPWAVFNQKLIDLSLDEGVFYDSLRGRFLNAA